MPLSLRHAGLSPPDPDRKDYVVMDDGREVGRIYEDRTTSRLLVLALHLLFVFAFFPFPLDLATVGSAEFLLTLFLPDSAIVVVVLLIRATPAPFPALVFPRIATGGSGSRCKAVTRPVKAGLAFKKRS